LFQAEQFELFREKVEGGMDALIAENSDEAVAEAAKEVTTAGNAVAEASAAAAGDLTGSGGGTSEAKNPDNNKKTYRARVLTAYYGPSGLQSKWVTAVSTVSAEQAKKQALANSKKVKGYYAKGS